MIFQVFYEFATFHGTLFMDYFHKNIPHFPPYHGEVNSQPPHSPQYPVQSPLEPYSACISKEKLLYDHLDDLGFKFTGIGRFFNYVGNPYLDTDYGDFSHIKLIMAAWNDELQDDRETWEDDPLVCSMVSKVHDIFRLAHHVPIRI